MTSLYWFQPLSVFFSSFKTVTFWPVLQVCMGPSPNVWFCAFKSATLAYELLFSIGPRPHVWFLDAKQRILDWNYTALLVEDHTFCFCMQNFDFWTRITSLYGSQTWPVILCMYNSVVNIKITSLYGFQPFFFFFFFIQNSDFCASLTCLYGSKPPRVVLWMLISDFWTRITSLYGSQTWPPFCACTTACLTSELLVSKGPSPHLWFLRSKHCE